VFQPAEESNECFALLFNIWSAQNSHIVSNKLPHPTGWAALFSENISQHFFQVCVKLRDEYLFTWVRIRLCESRKKKKEYFRTNY
jgi:hypothetical protein